MTARSLIAGLVLIALAAPAVAQLNKGAGARLKPDEVKAALLGADMDGFSPTESISWRKCIEPTGETLYETPMEVVKGRLDISPDGMACFSYADTNYSVATCFQVYRQGKGIRFESDAKNFEGEPDSIFVTTKLVTGIKSCKPKSLTS